jgi:hypothetical protein
MLKVIPKMWSYTFSVMDGTQSVAQSVALSWWTDKGELQVQGTAYTARRDKSSYILESAAGILVRAEQPRKWYRELVIEYSGRQYTLRTKSMFRREFLLLEGATQIGSIAPEGLFTRKAAAELPKEFPLFLQVFVIWLAMTLWKHAEIAASS